jgi:hypothetical protein
LRHNPVSVLVPVADAHTDFLESMEIGSIRVRQPLHFIGERNLVALRETYPKHK